MESITNKQKIEFIKDFISNNIKKNLIYDHLLNQLMTEKELPDEYSIEDGFIDFNGGRSNHLFLICQK